MAMRARRRQAGFTYLGVIIFVTVIGMVGAATLKVGSLLQRAEAEYELLEIGAEFSTALRSYAAATPNGQPAQPAALQDLLRDPRFPNPRRHLRRIFVDPITGKAEWGIMAAAEGAGILGVYSLSQAKPLKIAGFDARFINFENSVRLSDWKFTAHGQGVTVPRDVTPGAVVPLGAPAAPQAAGVPAVSAVPAAAPVAEQSVLRELVPPSLNDEKAEADAQQVPADPTVQDTQAEPEKDEAEKEEAG